MARIVEKIAKHFVEVMALVLGLVGGLLSFVPYVSAVIAAVPVTRFALAQGPNYAVAVIARYVAVHFIEGNFVQSEAKSLPPVVCLLSVIAREPLLGTSAAFLAAPLALSTVIEILHVETRITLDKGELDHRR